MDAVHSVVGDPKCMEDKSGMDRGSGKKVTECNYEHYY